MSDEALPEPLVPAEVDLNGYGFMPMLHHRVLQSTLFIKSTGDEFKAAFALWCASWSEKPAGTLPNDDEMLEALARSKTWKKVKARALHGWILCSDGRLHHPVLAPLAIDAWGRREEFREEQENRETRQERWRRRVKELSEQLRELGVTPPRNAGLEKLETMLRDAQASTRETLRDGDVDAAVTSHARRAEMALTETETGTETKKKPPNPQGGEGRFPDFWSIWPNTDRKADRKKCLAKWQRCGFDAEADAVLAHVTAMKSTRQWRDGYEPAPLTYLNGERWRDGVVPDATASASNDIFAGAK